MADYDERNDRFRELGGMYEGYQVNDRDGEKVGKVDDLFVDEEDRAEYIGVKMGLLGMNSTLIPMEVCRVDEADQTITVSVEKDQAQNGPDFDDEEAITPDFERRVRDHYSLEHHEKDSGRGAYGAYYSDEDDVEKTEGAEHDDDELRIERTEEELRAGTREREREDGGVKVRKRTRTDRERVRVPKKREEVTVERVSMGEEEGSSGAETVKRGEASEDEEEIRMPVKEEEVVTEKRPVAKEEIHVSKDVVEDEEVVEEDIRKEEVDIEGESHDR